MSEYNNNDHISDEDNDPLSEDAEKIIVYLGNISNAHPAKARRLYRSSPAAFLSKFGPFLQLKHFSHFQTIQTEQEDIERLLVHFHHYHSEKGMKKRIRNRRYAALKKMQIDTDYFSDKEMMWRDPLLYEQLVGRYLDPKERINIEGKPECKLSSLLLAAADKDELKSRVNAQLGSAKPTLWGEFNVTFNESQDHPDTIRPCMISARERHLLHEEFRNEMFNRFLDGRDTDFDYSTIDLDDGLDDVCMLEQDKHDHYFDAEPAGTSSADNSRDDEAKKLEESSKITSASDDEDPLDVYMKHLNKQIEFTS